MQYWLRAYSIWTTVVGLLLVFYLLWRLPTWLHNFTVLQLVTETSIRVSFGLIFAALVALIATLIWVMVGGLRATPSGASRRVANLEVAAAALAIVITVITVLFQWLGEIGIQAPLWAKLMVAALGSAVIAATLSRQRSRLGHLDRTSKRLQDPSRRVALAALATSISAAALGGVRWRNHDRPSKAFAAGSVGARKRPNIVLVTYDALSALDMSLYGYKLPTTLNLERFARDSIVFEKFYAASNFTTSSVISMLSGKKVSTHHWYLALEGRLADEVAQQNVAAMLREAGYATAAVVANPWGHPAHYGFEQSFDYLPPPPIPAGPASRLGYHLTHSDIGNELKLTIGDRFSGWARRLNLDLWSNSEFPPPRAFDAALKFLDKRVDPYFLWVHLVPPHFPYQPPPPFRGKFLRDRAAADFSKPPLSALVPEQGIYGSDVQPEIDKVRLLYDEYLAYADDTFGSFLGELRSRGTLDDSVLIFSSDHGECFANGYWGHSGLEMWNPVMHVPLIVRLPGGIGSGTRVSGVAGQIDLLPTMLDLAGVNIPAWAEGQSLRGMWEAREAQGRVRSALVTNVGPFDPVSSGVVAAVSGDDKCIVDIASGRAALFDLATDPYEKVDLAAKRPQRTQELRTAALRSLSQR